MKPESILQSDILDIIFINRNKAYGAYELRKEYNKRLIKALTVTFCCVVILSASWFISNTFGKSSVSPLIISGIIELSHFDPDITAPKKIPKIQKTKVAVVNNSAYKIVPDNKAGKIPTRDDLDNKVLGTVTIPGILSDRPELPPLVEGNGTGTKIADKPKIPEPEIDQPFEHAEVMPEFPGGMEALKKYLMRSLSDPEGLEPGQKLVVIIRFIVGIDGSIEGTQVLQGVSPYNQQVLNVIKRMPNWKPGMQNNRFVPVYFTLPVTFVGLED